MDSIPKIIASLVTIIIGVVLCISFILSSFVTNSARTYHSSVIEHIEASNFDEATIEKCKAAAKKDNYSLSVDKISTDESEPYFFYKVTLKYGLAAPIFGKIHTGTLVGYALSGAHVDIKEVVVVPGLYETGSNYKKLLKSWDDLVAEGAVVVTDGVVGTGYTSGNNASSSILAGDLMLPFDGSVTGVGDTGFFKCTELTGVKIPNSVKTIGQSAFAGCWELATVELGNGVETISDDAFNYSGAIEKVTYAGDLNSWCKISFSERQSNPMYYGADLYFNGTLIKDVTLPAEATTLENVFIGCTSLESITIPADSQLATIPNYAFDGCSNLKNVDIAGSVTAIGNYAFLECYNLQTVTIPATVTSIDVTTFQACKGLQSISVAAGNSAYHVVEDEFLIETSTNTLLIGCVTSDNTVIPEGVVIIGESAFRENENLKNLTIPSTVTSIDIDSFAHCSNISSINVASGNSVYHASGNCLINTSKKWLILGSVNSVIPADGSVTRIGNGAFMQKPITTITIPSGVTQIAGSAFAYCYSLKDVTIPATVTLIDSNSFLYCSSLTDVNFQGTVEQWNAITISDYWDTNTGEYTIHCTDGDIAK